MNALPDPLTRRIAANVTARATMPAPAIPPHLTRADAIARQIELASVACQRLAAVSAGRERPPLHGEALATAATILEEAMAAHRACRLDDAAAVLARVAAYFGRAANPVARDASEESSARLLTVGHTRPTVQP